jgi:TPR repeat protein
MTEEEREAYWQLQREKDERSRKLYWRGRELTPWPNTMSRPGYVKNIEEAMYWYNRFMSGGFHNNSWENQGDDWWSEGAGGPGMVNAEVRLGDIYYYGEGGIPQNSRKAFTYYTRASLSYRHSVYARYRVATMYELGDGITQNLEKALKFYKQVVNELGRNVQKV